jgi:hypothetical protein
MEQLKDLETLAECTPLTWNHETSKIYSALKQCMSNNAMLREALNEAAETIKLLTEVVNESKSD